MMMPIHKNDGDPGFGGDQPRQRGHGARQADNCDRHAVEHRITRPRAEFFPGRMADVDRRGKRRPEKRSGQCPQPIDDQARAHGVFVARRRGRLDVLQRRQHPEQPDGNHHRKISHDVSAAERREQFAGHGPRQVKMQVRQRPGVWVRPPGPSPGRPRQRRAHDQHDQRGRYPAPKPHAPKEHDEHQHQRHQPDDG